MLKNITDEQLYNELRRRNKYGVLMMEREGGRQALEYWGDISTLTRLCDSLRYNVLNRQALASTSFDNTGCIFKGQQYIRLPDGLTYVRLSADGKVQDVCVRQDHTLVSAPANRVILRQGQSENAPVEVLWTNDLRIDLDKQYVAYGLAYEYKVADLEVWKQTGQMLATHSGRLSLRRRRCARFSILGKLYAVQLQDPQDNRVWELDSKHRTGNRWMADNELSKVAEGLTRLKVDFVTPALFYGQRRGQELRAVDRRAALYTCTSRDCTFVVARKTDVHEVQDTDPTNRKVATIQKDVHQGSTGMLYGRVQQCVSPSLLLRRVKLPESAIVASWDNYVVCPESALQLLEEDGDEE